MSGQDQTPNVGLPDALVPDYLARHRKWDPDLRNWYHDYRVKIVGGGILSAREQMLIALAVVTAQRAPDAVEAYTAVSRNLGASDEEIREALRVGALFSGGPGILAASAAMEVIGEE